MTPGRVRRHAPGHRTTVGDHADRMAGVTPEAAMARTLSRQALPIVTAAFVACGVIQVFLAGLGVFDDPRAFITHREFGYLFGWLTLAILVLALVGGAPRRLTGLAVLLLVMFTLQSVFVALRTEFPAIAALHPLNGFALLAVAVVLARASWAVRRVAPAAAATTSAGSHDATRTLDPTADLG